MLWRRLTNALIERTLRFKAGAKLVVESGTNAAATEISMSELKAVNDLSATDLQKIDGITNGTIAANKAVVVDANKDASSFRIVRATRVLEANGTPTSLATAGAETYTAAQLLTGIIVRDPAGAGRTDTLDTAAAIVAAVAGAAVGDTLVVHIVNGADAAETITLAAGTGGGFDTNQTAASRVIPQNASKDIRIRLTNVTASLEAYVIYA